jgi:hypothetical protein
MRWSADLVVVHTGNVQRLDVQGVDARARTNETLAQHLFLLVVIIIARATAAGDQGSRRVVVASAVVGAVDLVLLEGR